MALVKCKECKKEINDKLKECPYCGKKNNIMICTECNKEISKKAKMCPYCGYKLRKGSGKVTTIVLIVLLIIISIISIPFIGYTSNEYYLYNYDWYNFNDYLLSQNIFSVLILVLTIVFIIFCIVAFKNKDKLVKKIFCILGIIIGLFDLCFYIPKRLYARSLDYDGSIKTIVDLGYSKDTASEIRNNILDGIFSYHKEDFEVHYVIYYAREENGKYILTIGDNLSTEGAFPLSIKITNNKLEEAYWDYNDDYKFYFFKDYEKTSKIEYYSKVYLGYHYIPEYKLKEEMKDMLKSPGTAQFGEFSIRYNNDNDTFYYLIDVDAQNTFGGMMRGTFRIDLEYTRGKDLDYKIKFIG